MKLLVHGAAWAAISWLVLAASGCAAIAPGSEAKWDAAMRTALPNQINDIDGGGGFTEQATGFLGGRREGEVHGLDDVNASSPTGSADPSRLMIYTGTFSLMVPNLDEAVDRFVEQVNAMGGYLSLQKDASVTVRIPAARFHETVESLPELGRVVKESIRARDVTMEHFDTTIRIQTAEKALTRLTELLAKAEKVEDLLAIEREIRRLTEELERLKGALKVLDDQIAFSTLQIQFLSNAPPPIVSSIRKSSRFHWINQVGVENALRSF